MDNEQQSTFILFLQCKQKAQKTNTSRTQNYQRFNTPQHRSVRTRYLPKKGPIEKEPNSTVSHIIEHPLPYPNDDCLTLKLVIVGNGACGKTCALVSFHKGTFPEDMKYVPTVFETYIDYRYTDKGIAKLAFDTPGQEDCERLRPLSYPNFDAAVISFAIDSPASFDNVYQKKQVCLFPSTYIHTRNHPSELFRSTCLSVNSEQSIPHLPPIQNFRLNPNSDFWKNQNSPKLAFLVS